MGNIIEALKRNIFDRRRNARSDVHSQSDHPEHRPPDALPTWKDTKEKSKLSSSTEIPTTEEKKTTTETKSVTTTMEMESESAIAAEEKAMLPTNEATAVSLPARCSDFYIACRTNQIEEVKRFLKTITVGEIDQIEPNGSTALHSAAYHGHTEIVQLLLVAGADRTIKNRYKYLPFDEAANDEIKKLFFRVPNRNRLASNTGAIEWEMINNYVLETAIEDRQYMKSLYENTTKTTPIQKMFERIERNYINQGLSHFDGIENIRRFFHKATEEEDPTWIIKAYTAETDFYKALNTEIACGASEYQNERRYIIALLSYHPKLDQYSFVGNAYRVVRVNLHGLDKYQPGCSLMTKSFLSTSIDEKIAAWFLCQQELTIVQNNSRERVKADGTLIKSWMMCKYRIKHRRTALYIEEISQYANEGEILIMPYTVFKINKVGRVKTSYLPADQYLTEIELEECDQYFNIEL